MSAPVAAPGGRRRRGPRRAARRARHRHGLRQVAGLPAARAHRDPRAAAAGAASAGAGVLYLAPTKALAQDQLDRHRRARPRRPGHHPRRRQHPRAARLGPRPRRVRPDQPRHAAPLAAARGTSAGRAFLGSLRYVVVDECHHYRGVFGAHVAHVLRRLRRICAMYGAHPTFVLASATVAEPEVAAGRLTGLDVLAITDRRTRRGAQVSLAAVGAAVHVVRRRERRPGAPRRVVGGRRPAGRPGRRGRPHAGVRPVAPRRRAGGRDRRRAARRGRPVAAGAGGGVPRRLPARGAPRARGGAASRRADRARRHQRPRARHRHQRARRGADRRASPAPAPRCGSRSAGPGAARRTRWACWSPATTRSTPTS